jgi:site-specific DNA-methyltransferase (cytosine-N4-specific)
LDEIVKYSDWTFDGASTRYLTHCYHDYPARMIPQVAGKLLDLYAPNARLLFDPYCGTGTSLVEGLVRGIDGLGTDLNPLARLIARAKTCLATLQIVDDEIARFDGFVIESGSLPPRELSRIAGIARLDFWFKPDVIQRLARIREFVEQIENEPVRLFFQVAFSETVRASSNSRNGEFKLYRYDAERLERFAPDVCAIMAARLKRNRAGLQQLHAVLRELPRTPRAEICDFNTVQGVPAYRIAAGSVDIVVTSPPYGDSHTTVAYGQYSRLSAAWLGLSEPDRIDRQLMGERLYKKTDFPSEGLQRAINRVAEEDEKRAREVSAFYQDLYNSICHVAEVIRPRGYACYVIGNRKVKGVVLPTDVAIRSFFQTNGFEHVDTFHRFIPNKRMPLRNSPTNISGAADDTMVREHIVVMRRRGLPTA